MENFITGFPGHESSHRAAMLSVLGKANYDYFFDKFLEYFFTEQDAKFCQRLGINCLRLPFNYRHFEDDMNPRVLKEEGFKHLDRVIDLVRPSLSICGPCLTMSSALNTRSTPSSICIPCLGVSLPAGMPIT
jgi:hypothetical protein